MSTSFVVVPPAEWRNAYLLDRLNAFFREHFDVYPDAIAFRFGCSPDEIYQLTDFLVRMGYGRYFDTKSNRAFLPRLPITFVVEIAR